MLVCKRVQEHQTERLQKLEGDPFGLCLFVVWRWFASKCVVARLTRVEKKVSCLHPANTQTHTLTTSRAFQPQYRLMPHNGSWNASASRRCLLCYSNCMCIQCSLASNPSPPVPSLSRCCAYLDINIVRITFACCYVHVCSSVFVPAQTHKHTHIGDGQYAVSQYLYTVPGFVCVCVVGRIPSVDQHAVDRAAMTNTYSFGNFDLHLLTTPPQCL